MRMAGIQGSKIELTQVQFDKIIVASGDFFLRHIIESQVIKVTSEREREGERERERERERGERTFFLAMHRAIKEMSSLREEQKSEQKESTADVIPAIPEVDLTSQPAWAEQEEKELRRRLSHHYHHIHLDQRRPSFFSSIYQLFQRDHVMNF